MTDKNHPFLILSNEGEGCKSVLRKCDYKYTGKSASVPIIQRPPRPPCRGSGRAFNGSAVGCGHQVNPTTAESNASNAGDVREATASDSRQNTEQSASPTDNLQGGDGLRNFQTPYPHPIGRHPLAEARGPLPIFSSTTHDRPNHDEQISTCIEAITSFDALAMLKTHQFLTDISETSSDLMRKEKFKSDEILLFAISPHLNCQKINKCQLKF
jgi:hypothetical protein